MSLFSRLKDKIFGTKEEEAPTPAPEPGAEAATEEAAAPAAIDPVDVAKQLTEMEAAHPEDLDWKRYIVDLMKLVDMDSSYGSRKELALELGYSQADIDSKGSAEMNMWLHKRVMQALAENGGTVPAEYLD